MSVFYFKKASTLSSDQHTVLLLKGFYTTIFATSKYDLYLAFKHCTQRCSCRSQPNPCKNFAQGKPSPFWTRANTSDLVTVHDVLQANILLILLRLPQDQQDHKLEAQEGPWVAESGIRVMTLLALVQKKQTFSTVRFARWSYWRCGYQFKATVLSFFTKYFNL